MKKIYVLLSLSIITTIVVSAQPVLGGKLESFIGPGESTTAMCGLDEISDNLLNVELDSEKRIQINCGSEQVLGKNIDMNVNLNEGQSVTITCVPPATAGEVVTPMTLNSTQKVFCSTTSTAN